MCNYLGRPRIRSSIACYSVVAPPPRVNDTLHAVSLASSLAVRAVDPGVASVMLSRNIMTMEPPLLSDQLAQPDTTVLIGFTNFASRSTFASSELVDSLPRSVSYVTEWLNTVSDFTLL